MSFKNFGFRSDRNGGSRKKIGRGKNIRLNVSVVVGACFRKQGVSRDSKPRFAEKSNESFPVFVGNLGCFESAEKVTIFLGVIVALIDGLLSDNRGDKSVKFGNVLVDGVRCEFLEIEELAFKAEFVFARLRCIALLKGEPNFGGGGAGFDASFVFVGDGLIEKCLGLDDDLRIENRDRSSGRFSCVSRREKIVEPFAFGESVLNVRSPGAIVDRIELRNCFVGELRASGRHCRC